jgi:hypothetical protein
MKDLPLLETRDIVRKHILMHDCYILDHDGLFDLCSKISKSYGIHSESVRIVGSGKLGFSIAEGKRYRPFCASSDIDVAVVSDALFDRYWLAVLRYLAGNPTWEGKSMFRKYLTNGWIRPDALPTSDAFPMTREWWEFYGSLSGSVLDGKFRINAGIYRTFEFLEIYQERSVASCKTALELSELA